MAELLYEADQVIGYYYIPQETPQIDLRNGELGFAMSLAQTVGAVGLQNVVKACFRSAAIPMTMYEELPDGIARIDGMDTKVLTCREGTPRVIANHLRKTVGEMQADLLSGLERVIAPQGSDRKISQYVPRHTGYVAIGSLAPDNGDYPLWVPKYVAWGYQA